MNSLRTILFVLLVGGIFFLVHNPGFANEEAEGGKIPITTSSKQAKNDYLKGRDLAEKLRIQDSMQYFQKAIEADPNFAVAYLNLAFAEPSARAFIEDVNKAAALSGRVSKGEKLWILAVQAGANGFPARQGDYFETLVEAYPNDERAHNLLGTYHFGLQHYDKAIREYEKAVNINPEFTPAYNLLGYAYRFQEQYDKSEKTFRKYIELIPNDPNPYDSFAELLMRIGRYDESIQNYRKALNLDSHFVNSYIGIATNLDFKGEHANARKELQKLLEAARNDGEKRAALLAMTISYVSEGDYQRAQQELDRQLELAKKMNDPAGAAGDLNTIGLILLEGGHTQEAKAKFDESLNTVSSSNQSEDIKKIAARNHLFLSGQAALQGGDIAAAESGRVKIQKQAEAEKNQFWIWLAHELAGRIALQKKDYDRAIAELNQSNLQDPYNVYRLAVAYRSKKDEKNAKLMFQRVADFNALSNLNYAFVRDKAKQALASQP